MHRFLLPTLMLACSTLGCARPSDPGESAAQGQDAISGNFPAATQLITIEGAAMHTEPDPKAPTVLVIAKGSLVQSGAPPRDDWYAITWKNKTGWVAGRWLSKKPQQSTGKLDVPYECQNTNGTAYPGGTCQITSASMVLRYWSRKGAGAGAVMANGVFAKYVNAGRIAADGSDAWKVFGNPSGIVDIFRDYGLHGKATTTGTRAQMRAHLDAGRPLVVNNYFTTGHVIVFTGYDANGWFVNDPNGQWNGTPNVSGAVSYAGSHCPAANGESVHISYPLIDRTDVIGQDGDIWFAVADKNAF